MNQLKSLKISDFATIDIETDQSLKIILIGLIYKNESRVFYSVRKLMEYLTENDIKLIIAYNGGRFDFLLILNELNKKEKFKIINVLDTNGLLFVQIEYKSHIISFYDPYFIFRRSLNEIAKNLIGQEKINLDVLNIEKYSKKEIAKYCLHDCRLLQLSMIKFFEHVEFRPTISQIALAEYKKIEKRKLRKLKENEIDNYRKFYYGGRVEVIERYAENIFVYDINSCYPYAMLKYGAIYGSGKYSEKVDKGLYFIKLNSDYYEDFPILCYKNDKNYFVCAERGTTFYVTDIEARYLIEKNVDFTIIWGYSFTHYQDFFKNFVEKWYNLKKNDSKEISFIAKLVLNSLYGKFGQNHIRKSVVIDDSCEKYYFNEFKLGLKETKYIANFMHPEVAAYVTSGARMILKKYVDIIGTENIVYCDTDSIFSKKQFPKEYINDEIGMLKYEGFFERCYFIAPKFYGCFGKKNKITVKGFMNVSLSEEDFKEIMNLQTFSRIQRRFKRYKQSFRNGNFIEIEDFIKKINEQKPKRKFLGNRSIPYILTSGGLK